LLGGLPTNLQDAVDGRTDRSIRASFRRLHWHHECRPCAWSVRSEHHLGQRTLSAQTGRTSDSKRSGQKSATILTSGGPSTSATSTARSRITFGSLSHKPRSFTKRFTGSTSTLEDRAEGHVDRIACLKNISVSPSSISYFSQPFWTPASMASRPFCSYFSLMIF
jgi:hypothetical protein